MCSIGPWNEIVVHTKATQRRTKAGKTSDRFNTRGLWFIADGSQERLSEEMCTRQSRKVIWDTINTLFVTTEAVEPTFVAFL